MRNMATLFMKSTMITNMLKLNLSTMYQLRNYTSALYIPGNRASETFSLLSPVLDFDERFNDTSKLQCELDCRGFKIDVSELKKSWEFYKYIDTNRKTIEKKREDVAHKIKLLTNKKKVQDVIEMKEVERLKILGTVIRHDLRIIKETLWELEETVIPRLLKLPNKLDEMTPMEPVIMRSIGQRREPTKNNQMNHIDIGKSLSLIEYENPLNYYLCNDAALFEIAATTWAGNVLANNGMERVSGTDFNRSLVVEAAGLDHEDPFRTFLLNNNEDISKESCNRLHLMGGASLTAFLAMHTKQLINPKHIPICYYATGRQYQPFNEQLTSHVGLFGVSQITAVQCMALMKNNDGDEQKKEFAKLIGTALKLYDDLGMHYRVVLRSISELNTSESLRVSFELWSSSCQDYIEVGHLSLYGNYISKRLLIAYQTPTGRDYPVIISGTILSIPRLLGCLLEEDVEKFNVPSCIRAHFPVDTFNEKS